MRLSDLQTKTIVNVADGKNIGSIIDANIDSSGNIESLVIEAPKKMLSFSSKDDDMIVMWKEINKIGDDVILVDVKWMRLFYLSVRFSLMLFFISYYRVWKSLSIKT